MGELDDVHQSGHEALTSDSFSGDEPCKATRLDGLDALRGIAALLVTVMHIQHVNGSDDAFVRSYLAVAFAYA